MVMECLRIVLKLTLGIIMLVLMEMKQLKKI